jgi:hypothetical protein
VAWVYHIGVDWRPVVAALRRFFMMIFRRLAFGLVWAASCLAACGEGGDGSTVGICEAGSNVFCRCRGGGAGTKLCNAAGDGFGACETARGSCDEVDDPSSSSGAGGATPAAPGELLGPCTTDGDCKDGMTCPMGFCTKPCETYEDCGQGLGDCLVWQGSPMCAPYCIEHANCQPFGSASVCSYTEEVLPSWPVTVCAHWPTVVYPPDSYPPEVACDEDRYCNFGDQRTGRVCNLSSGFCTDGCHADTDCITAGDTCDDDGSGAGLCTTGGSTDVDDCPGDAIELSLADPSASIAGDTSALTPPAEHTFVAMSGVSSCGSPGAANAEEAVYAVSFADDGTLSVDVSTRDSGHDVAIYARFGSCASGTQLACSDEGGGAGAGEAMLFDVYADETIWIFVDGWNGSTGPYDMILTLE